MGDLRALVEKDLFGKTTEEENQTLFAKVQQWRNELKELLQDIDRQLTGRRAEKLAAGTLQATIDYEKWKKGAVGRKLALVSRLSEVNVLLKQRKQTEAEEDLFQQQEPKNQVLRAILGEVATIRKLLEERV